MTLLKPFLPNVAYKQQGPNVYSCGLSKNGFNSVKSGTKLASYSSSLACGSAFHEGLYRSSGTQLGDTADAEVSIDTQKLLGISAGLVESER